MEASTTQNTTRRLQLTYDERALEFGWILLGEAIMHQPQKSILRHIIAFASEHAG